MRSSCACSSVVNASPKSAASNSGRISISESSSSSVFGQRRAHSSASSIERTCQIQKPATSSFVSENGPSMTVRFVPENRTRLPFELGWRPSPASMMPALTSSSLKFPMSVSSFWSGSTPASEALSAFTITRTRIVRSPSAFEWSTGSRLRARWAGSAGSTLTTNGPGRIRHDPVRSRQKSSTRPPPTGSAPGRPRSPPVSTAHSDVLVHQDRVPVRVRHHEVGGPGRALVRLGHELDALRLEPALQLAHVRECGQLLRLLVPAGIEREHVLLEHALEQPDDVVAVLEDQPVLRRVPAERLEAEHLVELLRRRDVLHREADRERPELHVMLLG